MLFFGFLIFCTIVLVVQEVALVVTLFKQIFYAKQLKAKQEEVEAELDNERFMYKQELEKINAPLEITDDIKRRAAQAKVHPGFIAWRDAVERDEANRIKNIGSGFHLRSNPPVVSITIPESVDIESDEEFVPDSPRSDSSVEQVTSPLPRVASSDSLVSLIEQTEDHEAKEDDSLYREAAVQPEVKEPVQEENGVPITSYLNYYLNTHYFNRGKDSGKSL